MKVKDIFADSKVKIFVVTNQSDENELNWEIEPTDFELLPDDENTYFVKAFQVMSDNTTDCFLGIITPERIAETVIRKTANGKTVAESIYDMESPVIPAVASNCFGDYELYYAQENPQTGIDVLRNGLDKAKNKNVVAEDLGYILSDERRFEESIEAFKISEENEPSSEYTYWELSRLYEELGNLSEQLKYEQKYKDNGGIDL
jgi:tetratricopeptide (TPR) repeat protein